MSEARYAHLDRVAAILDHWAGTLVLDLETRTRWRTAGWLHDALKDADPEELREGLPPEFATLAPPLLHGPAAAERLASVADADLVRAIRYHTIGHPDFDLLGRALYLADFLDPARTEAHEWRSALRDRMPHDMEGVLIEVIAARIGYLLDQRKPILTETVAFWNRIASGAT